MRLVVFNLFISVVEKSLDKIHVAIGDLHKGSNYPKTHSMAQKAKRFIILHTALKGLRYVR